MKKGQNLFLSDHVVRQVSPGRLRKDADGNVVGVLHTAFERPETHDGLSVSRLEHFPGERDDQLRATVGAIRNSLPSMSKNSGFVVGNVEAIKNNCLEHNQKIRIIYMPEDDNPAHSELRQFPRSNDILFEELATETWCELHLNSKFP